MEHFRRIITVDGLSGPDRRATLFSVPGDLTPHASAAVRVDVARYFVGGVAVGEVWSSGHDTFVTEPGGATLILPGVGSIEAAEVGGPTLTARPGEALLFSPNRRHTRVIPEGGERFLGVPLVFPRLELGEIATRLGMSPRDRRRLDAFALAPSAAASVEARELILLARSLYEMVAEGSPALLDARAHRSWSRRLSEKLICLLDSAGIARLPRVDPGRSADHHVRRALEFMYAHYDEIQTIADVADACEIGTRALEVSFRQVWAQPPHRMLGQIRLEAARRALVSEAPPASVTEAALNVGFGHLGRFALSYLARFGEAPSQTLRRTRG